VDDDSIVRTVWQVANFMPGPRSSSNFQKVQEMQRRGFANMADLEMQMPRLLILAGIILVIAGLAMQFGVPLGRLPGDIIIKRGNGTFYFPIVTCIVVSVLLSVIAALLRR
jgi:hypothetical protein